MKTLVLVPALLLFSLSPIFAAEKLPNDVRQFIAQRDACDHFRGELPEPEEAERIREVTRQIEKRCLGTDRRLHSLKKKYGSDANVKKRLNVYDEQVEPRTLGRGRDSVQAGCQKGSAAAREARCRA